MTIPSENKKILTNLGRVNDYSWDRPAPIVPRVNLTSYVGAKYILEHQKEFKVTWGEGLGWLMDKGGLDFMLAGDTPFHKKQRETMGKALLQRQLASTNQRLLRVHYVEATSRKVIQAQWNQSS